MLWSDYSGSIIIRCWLPDPSVLKPLWWLPSLSAVYSGSVTMGLHPPSTDLQLSWQLCWNCERLHVTRLWHEHVDKINRQTHAQARQFFLKHFKLSLWYPVLQSASPETQFSIVRHTPALTLTAAVTGPTSRAAGALFQDTGVVFVIICVTACFICDIFANVVRRL